MTVEAVPEAYRRLTWKRSSLLRQVPSAAQWTVRPDADHAHECADNNHTHAWC